MTHTQHLSMLRRYPASRLAGAAFSLALLAGCGSADSETANAPSAASGNAKVALSVAEDPCGLISREALAEHFTLPADKIEQIAISSTCSYDWKDETDQLRVTVNIAKVAQDAAEVGGFFERATRSMSAQEISEAMGKVRAEAQARGEDNALLDGMADDMGGNAGGRGIQFEDVSGIGDKARLKLSDGTLNILHGNLYFEVRAYHGPKMPMPDSIDLRALGKHSAQWEQETMPQRKAAAEQLAKIIIAGL